MVLVFRETKKIQQEIKMFLVFREAKKQIKTENQSNDSRVQGGQGRRPEEAVHSLPPWLYPFIKVKT